MAETRQHEMPAGDGLPPHLWAARLRAYAAETVRDVIERTPRRLRGWAKRVVLNLVVDGRRLKRRRETPLPEGIVDRRADPIAHAAEAEEAEDLQRLVERAAANVQPPLAAYAARRCRWERADEAEVAAELRRDAALRGPLGCGDGVTAADVRRAWMAGWPNVLDALVADAPAARLLARYPLLERQIVPRALLVRAARRVESRYRAFALVQRYVNELPDSETAAALRDDEELRAELGCSRRTSRRGLISARNKGSRELGDILARDPACIEIIQRYPRLIDWLRGERGVWRLVRDAACRFHGLNPPPEDTTP